MDARQVSWRASSSSRPVVPRGATRHVLSHMAVRAHSNPRNLGDGWPWVREERQHGGIAAELLAAGISDDEARVVGQ